MRRSLSSLLAASALIAPLAARQKPAYTFHASTRLVLEPVQVETYRGEPIPSLTARDFVVTENGVRQVIAFCRYQKLADVPTTAPREPQPSPRRLAATLGNQLLPGEIGLHYNDRRLLALYFDMTAMPVDDQLRAISAAQQFTDRGMRPADMVAIMDFAGNGVRVQQAFTDNHSLLRQALAKLIPGSGTGIGLQAAAAANATAATSFGEDDAEFSIFYANRQLAALQTAIDMLAPIPERKALVYFASGLRLRGVDNQAQLTAATNAAIKANVALYPLDARGLVAAPPVGDAAHASPGGVAMYDGSDLAAASTRRIASQDTLYALGSDTGGKAILDTNNLAAGIATARSAIGSYYLLGYYTTNPAQDGRFRRIQVALAQPIPGVKLSYRTGYYAGKVFAKFNAADKERQLADALRQPNPITQLTMDLVVNYFQLDSANYFIPVAVRIPGSELTLVNKGGAWESRLDVIGEVRDNYGTTWANVRDQVPVKLTGTRAEAPARPAIEYTTGFTLLPGAYSIKLLVRDDESGRIGTYLKQFTVPNLMRAAGLPISSVVLASQRIPLGSALFNAQKSAAGDAVNPLVGDGLELLPSVTHVFSPRQSLYIYLQAYEHGPATKPMRPIEAYVTFYRKGTEFYRTPMLTLSSGRSGPAGAIPIAFTVPLTGFATGAYTCQVSVLDPGGGTAAFWRGAILVLP